MMSRRSLSAACALAISLGAFDASFAQSNSAGAMEDYWTVLTMSPDGSWGAATNPSTNQAIASAMSDCKIMSQAQIGCGYQSTIIRSGWSFGIRCGNENIIVAEKTLLQAEQAAINREAELRQVHVPDMRPCVRVVSIDPRGAIVAPNVAPLMSLEIRPRDGISQRD